MSARRPPAGCDALLKWLKLNGCELAALTGTDRKALAAAAHILELYAYTRSAAALDAFRLVVLEMQPTTREFAYHAVASLLEWDSRARVWSLAGLPPLERVQRLKGERPA